MKIVYRAENILDAHLVKGALEHHGVPAFVTGEYLTGALGELPAHGLVAIIVADDHVETAEAFVEQLAQDRRAELEPDFEVDWQAKPA